MKVKVQKDKITPWDEMTEEEKAKVQKEKKERQEREKKKEDVKVQKDEITPWDKMPEEEKEKVQKEKKERQEREKKENEDVKGEEKEEEKEKKETLTTVFGERMLGSMPSDEVGVAPAAPATPHLSAYRRADRGVNRPFLG